MSESDVPQPIRYMLWGKAAGRCQYRGCNRPLFLDVHTQAEFNQAYIAHIIADRPNGPRGDETLSPLLGTDISNLMLLCDSHHRLIDRADVEGHPAELLQEMKSQHEERIEMVTGIIDNMNSHVLHYGSNIGDRQYPVRWELTVPALLPFRYPVTHSAIELSWKNSTFYDNEEIFWRMELTNLRRQIDIKIKPLFMTGELRHLSVFAIAPQPLLIALGTMLTDLCPADVFQLQREPVQDWKWDQYQDNFELIVMEPIEKHQTVALNFSLSATIAPDRITRVLGDQTSIWTVTIPEPHNDFMKSKEQLMMFRMFMRKLLNKIKHQHGDDTSIHVFPAMPVSTAIELGRVWMPKADLPMYIYDENRSLGGFIRALEINNGMNQTLSPL
ncbi:HNH endonuclease [Cohnella sp. WQ 127256]|uniref:HNH endonuclease n=1 Tax=Cohnella sp. WQ 127256 TaxID=2938790 RepID=UPI002118791B|nr:HNH endonuclease [Cohnella sp. WQ 127256]